MTDRELLELAAKAAGIEVRYQPGSHRFLIKEPLKTMDGTYFAYWDPLTDDRDALRLAVSLNIRIKTEAKIRTVTEVIGLGYFSEDHGNDPYTASRRAIVRAAAEIGRSLTPKE